jgi:hypothetical protein
MSCGTKAEANIVVAVVRIVPIAISGTAILRIVVPRTATQNTISSND